jgi:hypothetical protein
VQRVGKHKRAYSKDDNTSPFDKARDELLSHILQCGVLQAEPEHQKDWFDDTMEYLAERYPTLAKKDLKEIRAVGEQYCRPVKRHKPEVGATS